MGHNTRATACSRPCAREASDRASQLASQKRGAFRFETLGGIELPANLLARRSLMQFHSALSPYPL
eukprot:869204-Prorocentrum_minimum.AAC.2